VDSGGQDIAFYHVDSVKLALKDAGGGNYIVAGNAPGDWREYTVNIPNNTYSIIARAATPNSNAKMVIKLGDGPDGINFRVLDTMSIANTGSYTTFKNDTAFNVVVSGGGNGKVLRMETLDNFFDIDWVEFITPSSTRVAPALFSSAKNGAAISIGNNLFVISEAMGTHYSIVDISGRLVMQGNVSKEQGRIDLSGFRRGAYLITVSSGNGNLIQKMILK
jgi:hypothetical protein